MNRVNRLEITDRIATIFLVGLAMLCTGTWILWGPAAFLVVLGSVMVIWALQRAFLH